MENTEKSNDTMMSVFVPESVVIKEELEIKEEIPGMGSEEGDIATDSSLFTADEIKPEPIESVDCGEGYPDMNWSELQSGDSNSQSSSFLNENERITEPETPSVNQIMFTCKLCFKSYKRLGSYNSHMKTHSVSEDRPPPVALPSKEKPKSLKCPLCLFSAQTYAYMLVHHQEKHPNAEQAREFLEAKAREAEENDSATESSFQCGVCFRKLEDMASFFSHRKLHEQRLCAECGNMTSGNSVFHSLTHIGKALHPCIYCEKYFSQKSTLTLHEKLHTNEKSHKCSICKKTFVWYFELVNHKKTHSSERIDMLSIANKIKDSYHIDERKCKKCDKTFANIVDYCKHSRVHDKIEELTFRCHICDQTFNKVMMLLKHLKVHK